MSIKSIDIKKLYSLSAGRCNMCGLELVEKEVHIGEMAHIIAKKSKGPRGKDIVEDNSYDNLILLCPNDHSIVDKASHLYPVEHLQKIKEDFEKSISLRLSSTKNYLTDLSSLNILFQYIPINSFRAMACELPNKVSVNFGVRDIFDAFQIDYPQRYPFYNNKLTLLWERFVEKLDSINDWMSGTITNADNKLITLNEMLNNLESSSQGYNVYVNSDFNHEYLILNKRYLNVEQIEIATKNITILQQEFIYAHTDLVTYIRYNYNDIVW